jgi:Flp pilus assembly protein TadG
VPALWQGLRDIISCDRGVSAVEWAMIAPIVMVLLLGVMDFGAAAIHKMQMANSVRAGLQYATVRKPIQGDLTQIQTAIDTAAPPDETGTRDVTVTLYCQCPDGSAIACTSSCAGGDRSSNVSIVIQEDYQMMLGLPFAGSNLTLRAEGAVQLN